MEQRNSCAENEHETHEARGRSCQMFRGYFGFRQRRYVLYESKVQLPVSSILLGPRLIPLEHGILQWTFL